MTLIDVFDARRRLAGRIRRTPVVPSPTLTAIAGVPVSLKLESLQVTHSFKARGALNAVLQLVADGSRPHLVTASAGNHGQALAWAAATLGLDATVFTPHDAPATKLAGIRRFGARLRTEASDYEDAERRAKAMTASGDGVFVSPYNDPAIVAGAGTIAVEVVEDVPDVAALVVPVGGGGLVSGVAVAAKSMSASIDVVGVEAEASPAFTAARAAGRMVPITPGPTIADGLSGNADPDTITFDYIRRFVDRLVQVSEDGLREGVRVLLTQEHLVAEGAGAASVAAVLAGLAGTRGPIVAVVSGANIDVVRLADVIGC